ncbi:uncharacterized protein LOC115034270 [Acyrthosiphon pisum]|uniref:Uncharacterized protein n=1 Tax=Acyrthosiphon pisum TaxID=7029 RepID=A0A8R2JUA0_ACYPI|nr:uncharacterized protein LOC115034270 [Acyrthosiphon pisum]
MKCSPEFSKPSSSNHLTLLSVLPSPPKVLPLTHVAISRSGTHSTHGTSICSRQLSSPNCPAGRLPDPRTNTRAGFADVGSISVMVVLGKKLISRLLLCLGPVQAAAAAACRSNHRRAPEHPPLTPSRELPAWVGRLFSAPHAVVAVRREPPRGWLGGRQASWSDSPPKNVLSSSSVQYVHKPDIP